VLVTNTPKGGEFDRGIDLDIDLGIDLFNRAHFFEAHEVLEDVWRSLPRDRPSGWHPAQQALRLHVQGMVQLAVAFHHESTGNQVGARSVLERAIRNLNGADASFPDLDFDRLRAQLADWQKHLAGAVPRPKLPQVVRRKKSTRKSAKAKPVR
jgi:predicted metal-dependent hydrolase